MKTYIKYLLPAIVIILTIWSCEDFLDKQPLDVISKETFWNNENDVEMALAACYGRLNNDFTGHSQFVSGLPHFDGLSDNGYCQYSWDNGFNTVPKGMIESTTGGVISGMWYTCYRGITTCNTFLQNIGSVESLTDENRNKYIGEVLFIRSFWYNYLTQLYGDCPLLLTVPDVEEASQVKRTPKNDVITQILKDLDNAIAYLPDDSYNGTVVKASAQALKARICLYNEMWTEAASAAKAVLDNPKFKLEPNYRDLFSGPAQKNSEEILFSVKYMLPNIWHGMSYIHSWWISVSALSDLVDSYEKLPGWDPAQPYEKRDPRLRLSYYIEGDPFPPMSGGVFDSKQVPLHTELAISKFVDEPILGYNNNDQDIVHLRLADVKLMYAEAMLMDGKENDPSALAALNDVRARFGDVLPPLTALNEEAIRQERRVEFAFEGLRFFDIKRWRIAHIVMNNLQDPVGSKYFFDESKHYLWPIPQQEMYIMGTDFVQNPGY